MLYAFFLHWFQFEFYYEVCVWTYAYCNQKRRKEEKAVPIFKKKDKQTIFRSPTQAWWAAALLVYTLSRFQKSPQ